MVMALGPIDAQSATPLPRQIASQFFKPLQPRVSEVALSVGNPLQESSLLELIVNGYCELPGQMVVARPGGPKSFPVGGLVRLDSWRRRQVPQGFDSRSHFRVCHSIIAMTALCLNAQQTRSH